MAAEEMTLDLTEVECGKNLGFALEETRILPTEYKIMQSQEAAALLPCMKYVWNGRPALCYILQGRRPFSELTGRIAEERFSAVTADLFLNIAKLQENGFLTCRKLDIDFGRVYVDVNTHKTRLLYYPVEGYLFRDEVAFENRLRSSFIRILSSTGEALPERLNGFLQDLQDNSLRIREIGERLAFRSGRLEEALHTAAVVRAAVLTSVNMPHPLSFYISRDVFTIGRNGHMADGIIQGDRRVGRTHCRVCKKDGKMFLFDMGSINGTFLNRQKLVPEKPYELKEGDRIRIAGNEFQVRLELQDPRK